jgi:hypothetical protein
METSLLKVLRRRSTRHQIGAVTRLILTLLIIPALLRSPIAAQSPGGVAIIPDIALKHYGGLLPGYCHWITTYQIQPGTN